MCAGKGHACLGFERALFSNTTPRRLPMVRVIRLRGISENHLYGISQRNCETVLNLCDRARSNFSFRVENRLPPSPRELPRRKPGEVITLRTGPLVRRGANVSRVVPGAPASLRRALLPRFSNLNALESLPIPSPIIESSCLHVECKLPINLRQFLAQQFDPILDSDNDSILDMAAHADEATLSRVARAIRRYSTSRAREAWAECSMALSDFEREDASPVAVASLCLECARLEFGAEACEAHIRPQCLTVNLLTACPSQTKSSGGTPSSKSSPIPDRLQRQIEEFRAMRAAFGLSHFDLDCYVTGGRVMFTWRPLTSARALSLE